jgi:hypothetical protein
VGKREESNKRSGIVRKETETERENDFDLHKARNVGVWCNAIPLSSGGRLGNNSALIVS